MNVHLCYPLPLESEEIWVHYKPFVERFRAGWHQFPPGLDCQLYVMCHQHRPTFEIRELFAGMPVSFVDYNGNGCDVGSAQYLSNLIGGYQVSLTVHAYPHREGWLKRLVEETHRLDVHIAATSFSHEEKPHFRTACYLMRAERFRRWPKIIATRQDCTDFEMNALEFYGPPFVGNVTWQMTGNGFRQGDQSDMLLWDRHSDAWARSSPEEKQRLTKLAYPE